MILIYSSFLAEGALVLDPDSDKMAIGAMRTDTPMDDDLTKLIEASLDRYSGSDATHIFGVPASTERRRATVKRLLDEAKGIIAEEGMPALTFRNLSRRSKMGLGNLQYYFPSSEELVHALMRLILTDYLEELLQGSFQQVRDPAERLRTFFEMQFKDVQSRRTNALFMALWDLAQRDAFVAEWLGELYAAERALLTAMLTAIHPQEAPLEIFNRAAVVAALVEGMMPLYGPAAPPVPHFDQVHDAAIRFACLAAGIEPPRARCHPTVEE